MSSFTIGQTPRCFALVPAAGIGARSGAASPKLYLPIAGRAMMAHTLAALAGVAQIEATLVVLSPEDDQFEPVDDPGPRVVPPRERRDLDGVFRDERRGLDLPPSRLFVDYIERQSDLD